MRFGVQAMQAHIGWSEYLALGQELDRNSRFDFLWTVDHFMTVTDKSDNPHFEGWTALAALAQATRRVRLGCLVTGITYRHPAVLAKMATTVDHISGGRLELGVGAAWNQPEHRAYGFPFPPLKERMDRMEEALHLIKLLWTAEGPVTFRGRHYQLEEAPFSPQNRQRPHPPILVGGGGEKRTLRIAAQYADAVNFHGLPETVRHKLEVLRRHCQDLGRDPSQIRITVQALLRLTESEGARQRTVQSIATYWGVDAEEAGRRALVGSIGEIKERVAAYAAAGVQEIYVLETRLNPEALLRFSEEVIPPFQ